MTLSMLSIVPDTSIRKARIVLAVAAVGLYSMPGYGQEKDALVLQSADEIDLGDRAAQASALRGERITPGIARNQPRETRPPTVSAPNPNERETIKATETRSVSSDLLTLLVKQQAQAATFMSGVTFVVKNQERHVFSSGYSWRPIWNWQVMVDGRPSASIPEQDSSKPAALARMQNLAAPERTAATVAVVGVHRTDKYEVTTYGRLAFVDRDGRWQFDQMFRADAKTSKSELVDVIYLNATSELLAVGNADDKLWLLKFDIDSKRAYWSRLYDLTKFRLVPLPTGMTMSNAPKFRAAKLAAIADGDFVIVGEVNYQKDNKSQDDLLVVRLTPEGKIRWARACGGTNSDSGRSIYPLRDGSIIVGGGTTSKRDYVGWLVKLDAEGYVIWEQGVGRVGVEAIAATGNSGFAVADVSWSLFDVSVTRESPFVEYNWAGEHAWTKSGPSFGRRSLGQVLQEPALTCMDLLWVPTLNEAMSGRTQIPPMIRDRRLGQ